MSYDGELDVNFSTVASVLQLFPGAVVLAIRSKKLYAKVHNDSLAHSLLEEPIRSKAGLAGPVSLMPFQNAGFSILNPQFLSRFQQHWIHICCCSFSHLSFFLITWENGYLLRIVMVTVVMNWRIQQELCLQGQCWLLFSFFVSWFPHLLYFCVIVE